MLVFDKLQWVLILAGMFFVLGCAPLAQADDSDLFSYERSLNENSVRELEEKGSQENL